jgi:F420-dependent oxidoreductase-like protein
MRLGVHLVNFDYPGGTASIAPTLARVAAIAEDGGIANLSVMDHYFQLEGFADASGPMLEAYTTLGYLAGLTRTVELQVLVTGVTYRYPGLLAKIASTLDVLSGGRAVLGLGAAWYEREHRALGVPYPPVAERLEMLEETLQVIDLMWSGDTGAFDGRHFRLAETLNSPQPLVRPRIMIGGSGERKLLRLVARYADASNMFAGPQIGADALQHKYEVLAAHCAAEGTDPARIARTVLWIAPVIPDAAGGAAFVEQLRPYAAIGIEQVHVMPLVDDPVPFAEGLAAHVVPRLAEL